MTAPDPKTGQKGNILTIVLGGVAMTAVLGITTFSLLSGPLGTMVSVNKKSIVQSQVQAIARIALMDAQNQPSSGDCDNDGIVELRAGKDAGAPLSPVEYVPTALGTPTRDPWGNDYYYCTWDMGVVSADAACGVGAQRSDGADDPFRAAVAASAATKLASSQTVVAVFSSGADGVVDSTCANWVDDTTSVFDCNADDLCQSYTYAEAAKQVSGIWNLKSGSPSSITTAKDLEVGAAITIDAMTGNSGFTTVTSSGKAIASGGLKVPLETNAAVNALCGASYAGLLRYNDSTSLLQVCDGAAWISVQGTAASSSSTSAESEWAETAPSSAQIYYNRASGGVMVGTTSLGGNDIFKVSSTDISGAISIVQQTALRTHVSTDDATQGSSASFATLPTAGNSIVVVMHGHDSGNYGGANYAPVVSDNKGNTYTKVAQSTSGSGVEAVFVASNIPAPSGTFTVTVAPTAGATPLETWVALEVGGLATSGVFDTGGSVITGSYTVTTTGSAVQNNELALGIQTVDKAGGCAGMTPTAGWTEINAGTCLPTTPSIVYKIVPTSGAPVAHTWTNAAPQFYQAALVAVLKGASTNPLSTPTLKNMEVMSNNNTAGDHDAHINLYHAEGALASPADIEAGDNTGYLGFYGYGGGMKKGFHLTQEINNASGAADLKFALGNSSDTLETMMWIGSNGGLTVGPDKGNGGINVSGIDPDMLIDTYNSTAASASTLQLRKSRGTAGVPSALSSGDMIGAITWQGEDGNGLSSAAAMNVLVNGTVNNTRLDTDLVFQASPAGNASATAVNADVLRLKSGGFAAVNGAAGGDIMGVNGILRIVDTKKYDAPTWTGTVSPATAAVFFFYPGKAAWRMGISDGPGYGVASMNAYNSLGTGYDADVYAANSWNHASGGSIDVAAENSFALGSGLIYTFGPGSYMIGSTGFASTEAGWGVNDGRSSAPYTTAVSVDEFVFGATAARSAAISGGNITVNGSYSYAFGPQITINNANTLGDDSIFAINLDRVAQTYTQANTLAIMNGKVGVGNENPGAYSLKVTGTANKTLGGPTWTVASDKRLKDVKGPYIKGIRDIAQLHPIRFKYSEGNKDGLDPSIENVGFSAQAVQTVFPEAVKTRPDGTLDLDVHAINVAKINAIKDLHAEQEALKAEQAALRREQAALHARYEALRTETDRLMNAAGIPINRGFWLSLALPVAGLMAFGYAARKKK